MLLKRRNGARLDSDPVNERGKCGAKSCCKREVGIVMSLLILILCSIMTLVMMMAVACSTYLSSRESGVEMGGERRTWEEEGKEEEVKGKGGRDGRKDEESP